MANQKISALTALTGANVDPAADVMPIVDTSVTTTKKILVQELFNAASTLTSLTGAGTDTAADSIPIYDNSATTEKKITVAQLGIAMGLTGTQITNSLGSDVALNNTSNYFDGPSVAQGSTGTWFASGTITLIDNTSPATVNVKLWDGTTVIASCNYRIANNGVPFAVSLSGYIVSPVGNIRISAKDVTTTNGSILFNSSGNSKDSTISAFRVE
jgi:hypothetical protein